MDIYTNSLSLLNEFPQIRQWPEMEEILRRYVARRIRDWKLPVVACEAVGGRPAQAIPAVAAIACIQISLFLVDDLLDEDPRGSHHELGMPAVANLAMAFQAAGAEAAMQSRADPSVRLAVLNSLHQMVYTTALGQYWDSKNPNNEEMYWQVVKGKSASFYSTALHVGALLGGASFELASQIKQIGCLYGEMCQIHDDLNDSLDVPANPDWIQGRSPLPILFAEIVTHPEQARFQELRKRISEPEALAEAQDILLRSGGISYGIDQLLRRHKKACEMLAAIPLVKRSGLEELLEEQVRPVWSLFQSIGASKSELMAMAA